MINFLVMYPALSLALSGAGLCLLGLTLVPARNRRLIVAVALLAPISPVILVRLCALAVVDGIDAALNLFGPLSRAWEWAARTIASGGQNDTQS